MRLKQRVGDFRVRELLRKDYLAERGEHRVYRVTKRKLTSTEAARALAEEAGVQPGEVQLAGLKDRQGLTIQYMSVARGKEVRLHTDRLKVEPVGFARSALSSACSLGNAFELTVRALRRSDLARLRAGLPVLRASGTVNYFDDQRFGNLTHGQGWIFKDLAAGRVEQALRALLVGRSPRDDERHRRFKEGVGEHWGDWRTCRDIAGRFGAHHSVFEHLTRNPGDFGGAFEHVATRLKLIHLYAWQSHLWNRAVTELVRSSLPVEECVVLECEEGPLLAYRGAPPPALAAKTTFRLPGERLEDVQDARELGLLEDALALEGLVGDQMHVAGVSGFQLKGEDRALLVRPEHLRVRPAEPDNLNPELWSVRIRFELPRGSYATLIVKRLFARSPAEREERAARGENSPGGTRPGTRATGRGGRSRPDRPWPRREGRSEGRWRKS